MGALLALAACSGDCTPSGCGGCFAPSPLATVEQTVGDVERDWADRLGDWRLAEIGQPLAEGDGLRTGHDATAHLRVGPSGKLEVSPDTVIRFGISEGDGIGVSVEAGTAVLETGDASSLRMRFGVARLDGKAKVRMRSEGDSMSLEVLDGSISLEHAGRTLRLDGGEDARLGAESLRAGLAGPASTGREMPTTDVMGNGSDEVGDEVPSLPEEATRPSSGPRVARGELESAEQVALTARAGESFTVHDPKGATPIALDMSNRCPQGGVVEVSGPGGGMMETDAVARFILRTGRHRLRVRCRAASGELGSVAAAGTARVVRDSGRAPFPQRAPFNVVDLNGRRWTLRYQNQPPEVRVRWLSPGGTGPFVLHHKPPGGATSTLNLGNRAVHTFRSGSLADGTHQLWMQRGGRAAAGSAGAGSAGTGSAGAGSAGAGSAGAGSAGAGSAGAGSAGAGSAGMEGTGRAARTEVTRMRIAFDNTAPTAIVREPADASFTAGDTVSVSGIAQPRWSVSVDGRSIDLDGAHRFSTEVTVPADGAGVAVRLSHPRRGVHFYVRRVR